MNGFSKLEAQLDELRYLNHVFVFILYKCYMLIFWIKCRNEEWRGKKMSEIVIYLLGFHLVMRNKLRWIKINYKSLHSIVWISHKLSFEQELNEMDGTINIYFVFHWNCFSFNIHIKHFPAHPIVKLLNASGKMQIHD